MTFAIRGLFPKNVFELLGKDENSGTYALGWALERSPNFAASLAQRLTGIAINSSSMRVALQTHGEDRGYTDMEIRWGAELHAIVEAKRGFVLPRLAQLQRYRPRIDFLRAKRCVFVSVSALAAPIAVRRLPAIIDGVPVAHLSWGAIRGLAKSARASASSLEEKLWLRELIRHLEDYAVMNRTRDNLVYVVSLGSRPMTADGTHTWIDVVEKDGRYFHPVGNHWPTQPPNYIGFRYRGQLQSIHRVDSHDIVNDVSTVNRRWISTSKDHFVYTLGPGIRPASTVQAGGKDDSIKRSARVWCAIDTLLTGEYKQLGKAAEETRRRLAIAEEQEE